MVQVSEDTWDYMKGKNPLLQGDVKGRFWNGQQYDLNANDYMRAEVAPLMAKAVGGKVVLDPTRTFINSTHPALAIEMPNGSTPNAGAIGMVMGNDTGYATERIKSAAVSSLLGLEEVDYAIADRIWQAVKVFAEGK